MGVGVAALLTPKEDAVFGHTFELIIVLIIGLLIFGPKRVIEMGAAAGRLLRELRDAMKDMNWSSLTGGDEHGSDPLAELRDLPRTFTSSILNPPPATSSPSSPPAPAPTASDLTPQSPLPTGDGEARSDSAGGDAPTVDGSEPPQTEHSSADAAPHADAPTG